MAATVLALLLATLAVGGIACTLLPAVAARRWARRTPPRGRPEPASLLKPLHGAEPRLADNLATFARQAWDAPVQIVLGIQRAGDPAIAVADALAADAARAGGTTTVTLVRDGTPLGANAKVANLAAMAPAAAHDLLVLSDSDMAVPPDYLAIVAGALAAPGTGAVTCLYRGRGDAGLWSALGAAGSSYHFLPSVLLGLTLGLAKPCMGSTIALRRATLARIGGFAAFADHLADDYAIGAAIRGLGLRVAIPPVLLVHAATERSLAELWRHERRWAATLRAVDPAGYAGTAFTYPVPFAAMLVPLSPRLGLALLAAALASRAILKRAIDSWAGASTCPAWLLPLRDCLGLAVFVSAFVARSVDWRGATLTMRARGRIAVPPRASPESDTR